MRCILLVLLALLPATVLAEPPKHWAFQPLRAMAPPVDASGWSETAIDRFVAAKRHERGLTPVADTNPRTLARRIYFDLIGLPPTPEQIDAFVRDYQSAIDNPQSAIARLVDQLLANPHYGERWGRYWMDVVRYADTAGDNADYPIPEARLYRDYIIDGFNADKPFDQFVHEQIAGDILAKAGPADKYAERVIATGFLALSRRYLTAPYEMWHLTLENTIETFGMAFLGLNLRCARCHDHKFDPVSTSDYYGLYGFFAATTFPFAGSEEFASMQKHRQHFAPLLPPSESAWRIKQYETRLRELQNEIDTANRFDALAKQDPFLSPLLNFFARTRQERRNRASAELNVLKRTGSPPDLPVAYAVSEGKPAEVRVHKAGDPEQPGPAVVRGVPKFLAGGNEPKLPADGSGRLQLARWLTGAAQHLTARVIVNRLWQHHFGRGIVATPNNLGTIGSPPTHPELLDFLAGELIRSGWSIKSVHRRILLSRVYRLSSDSDEANRQRDPGNQYLWRHERRRLDAEAIRDALLAVSGNLNRRRPGPHPFPPIAAWGWTQHNPFKESYEHRHRSVYLMTQRIQKHPFLALFDGPDTNTSTEARSSSSVPLQALYWMNHPFVKEQAEQLARRLSNMGPMRERITFAFRQCYGRLASDEEVERGQRYVEMFQNELGRLGIAGPAAEFEAWTSYVRTLFSANEFVFME